MTNFHPSNMCKMYIFFLFRREKVTLNLYLIIYWNISSSPRSSCFILIYFSNYKLFYFWVFYQSLCSLHACSCADALFCNKFHGHVCVQFYLDMFYIYIDIYMRYLMLNKNVFQTFLELQVFIWGKCRNSRNLKIIA